MTFAASATRNAKLTCSSTSARSASTGSPADIACVIMPPSTTNTARHTVE